MLKTKWNIKENEIVSQIYELRGVAKKICDYVRRKQLKENKNVSAILNFTSAIIQFTPSIVKVIVIFLFAHFLKHSYQIKFKTKDIVSTYISGQFVTSIRTFMDEYTVNSIASNFGEIINIELKNVHIFYLVNDLSPFSKLIRCWNDCAF